MVCLVFVAGFCLTVVLWCMVQFAVCFVCGGAFCVHLGFGYLFVVFDLGWLVV